MGTIFPNSIVKCHRCGGKVKLPEGSKDRTTECPVCLTLGDRALVPLLRNPTPEAIERFRAAPPGSVLFRAGLAKRGLS